MVLKRAMGDYKASPEFENDVKTYGTQTSQLAQNGMSYV